ARSIDCYSSGKDREAITGDGWRTFMNSATTATVPASERRTATRRQPTLGTVCRLVLSTGEQLLGLVWNISASGVSMLVHRRLELGSIFPVELLAANTSYALPVSVRVAHVSQLQTGDYIMGGQFSRSLNADELRPFLAG